MYREVPARGPCYSGVVGEELLDVIVVSPGLARTKGARGPADFIWALVRKWGRAIVGVLYPRLDGRISDRLFAMQKSGIQHEILILTAFA